MTTEQTTFHRDVIKDLEDQLTGDESSEQDRRTGYVVYNLMTDINTCDRTLRRCAQAIKDRLAEMERNLDAFGTVYQVHISNPANDMTEAIAKREMALSNLFVLLGDKMRKALDDSRAKFKAEAEAKAGQ